MPTGKRGGMGPVCESGEAHRAISFHKPAERLWGESEEKARPAYEKALRPFRRLRAFSELVPAVGQRLASLACIKCP